jgi:uridine kinase
VLDKKYFLITVMFAKYLILLNFASNLEILRYVPFFELCQDFSSCLNPYRDIELLEKSYLSFPYSNLMYFILLPFYFIGKVLNLSFVNLSYLFFEMILIYLLQKTFSISKKNLMFVLVLNPLLIYSIGILGQLDFVPLTLFITSLYFLRQKNKIYSLFFLVLSFSTKIIFIILLPIVFLYFLKFNKNLNEIINTITITIIPSLIINIQYFFDQKYKDTILYGVNRGFSVINDSSISISNSGLLILIFLSFTLFLYWKNLHRLDFIGVCIFTGFITFPIYITNLSNIGWLLWSFPLFLILYITFEDKVKIVILTYFLLLVLTNGDNEYVAIYENYSLIFEYLIYFFSLLIVYYAIELLNKNNYYIIKSSPTLISIAGDSASGKTTLSKILEDFLGNKFVNQVELDSFHKYERDNPIWDNQTHLNPKMNDLVKFKNTVLNLISGQTQIVQNYNHLSGKFDSQNKKRIKDFLIIEGLHSLYFRDLNKRYDLKIFLDLEEDIKKESKLARDLERGRTETDILNQINQRKHDFIEFVLPQHKYADVSITTISRGLEDVSFDIHLKTEYFFELQYLLELIPRTTIKEISNDNIFTHFQLQIGKLEYKEIFSLLTNDLNNLKSNDFDLENYSGDNLTELTVKLSVSLFLLNKKLESRL